MRHDDVHKLEIANPGGPRVFLSQFIVCPNPECQKFTLTASLREGLRDSQHNIVAGKVLQTWRLVPDSMARVFPEYIPEPIRKDYIEACKISELSPKASATLARRCLQGILRDFWKVKPDRLYKEIAEIENKVDPLTWKAIDGVRKIGNIGAHMENDVNVVVDVEPNEAALLIRLIETLMDEWYVARFEREKTMKALVDLAAAKG